MSKERCDAPTCKGEALHSIGLKEGPLLLCNQHLSELLESLVTRYEPPKPVIHEIVQPKCQQQGGCLFSARYKVVRGLSTTLLCDLHIERVRRELEGDKPTAEMRREYLRERLGWDPAGGGRW